MEALTSPDIFFIISSIGFVLLWILAAIFLFYLIRITKTFSKIMEKVEKDIDKIGETTKEMIEEVRESALFHFLFGKKRKGRKNIKQ